MYNLNVTTWKVVIASYFNEGRAKNCMKYIQCRGRKEFVSMVEYNNVI